MHDVLGRFLSAFDFEADHGAESKLLFPRKRVSGVTEESGIVDTIDRRVRSQKVGDITRILLVNAHPSGERTDSAQS